MEELSKKTVMLSALSTASRAQTLANIDIRNIKKSQNGLEIPITKLLKTSGPGRRRIKDSEIQPKKRVMCSHVRGKILGKDNSLSRGGE